MFFSKGKTFSKYSFILLNLWRSPMIPRIFVFLNHGMFFSLNCEENIKKYLLKNFENFFSRKISRS